MSFLALTAAAPEARANTAGRARKSLGITLIETLLALAVGAVVVIGAIAFYISATSDNQQTAANRQLQAIVGNVRTLYSGQSTYAGLTNTLAISARAVPAEMVNGTGGLTNPWKGVVTLGASATGDFFTIQYAGVPKDACVKTLSMNNSGSGGSAQKITVNGTVRYDATAATATPITPATAVTFCANETTNTLLWEYR